MLLTSSLLTIAILATPGLDRALHTPEEVQAAQNAIEDSDQAKKVLDALKKRVEPFRQRSPQEIWDVIPPPEVPRAFNASFEGCPCHGRDLFNGGNYAWKMDPWNEPWKLICPIDGARYPSNDFGAFLASGMKDRSLLTGEWADDGWGVQVPGEPKKRWFIAYYCHWYWMNYLIPATLDLSRIYLLTGDAEYGLRAAVMLDRIADFYPGMDYNRQCRYAQEFYPSYTGKITNKIWECKLATRLCEAYDNIRPGLGELEYTVTGAVNPVGAPGDVNTRHRTGKAIHEAIRNRIVRYVLKGIFEKHDVGVPDIRGNFGMHQETAMTAALVLGEEKERQYVIDYLMGRNEEQDRVDSITSCIENMIFRDGIGYETAPSYSHIWTDRILNLSQPLYRLGIDLYQDPRIARLFTLPTRLSIADAQFSPTIGDAYNAVSGVTRLTPEHAYLGYRVYKEPIFAWLLADSQKVGEAWPDSYERLFFTPPDEEKTLRDAKKFNPPSQSSIFHDYGVSVLRQGSGNEQIAAVLQYGQAAGHGHDDRLGIEVFGYGAKLIPDLGYPQFASEEKQTYAWDRHTSSHATVIVDESKQRTRNRGKLTRFSSNTVALGFSYAEASAVEAYPGIETYRRGVALIEGPPAVIVDIFWVKGGIDADETGEHIHDWFTRGFDAPFSTKGLTKKVKREGTLAGEDVPYAFLHDDPELDDPVKKEATKRAFGSYVGSGYSYLEDVTTARGSSGWHADWKGETFGLRTFMLGSGVEQVALCAGRPPQRKQNPKSLRFVRLRSKPGPEGESIFVALIEPHQGKPRVADVKCLQSDPEGVVVSWRDSVGQRSYELHVEPETVYLKNNGKTGAELRSVRGRVLTVKPGEAQTDVTCTFESAPLKAKMALAGTSLMTDPAGARRAYPVTNAGLRIAGKNGQTKLDLKLGYEPWIGKNTLESVDATKQTLTLKYNNRLSGGGRFRSVWASIGERPALFVSDVKGREVRLNGADEKALEGLPIGGEVLFTDLVPNQEVELTVIVPAE